MKKVLRFPELKAKVIIKQDESPESPRSWENLGTCLFFHKRYNFGDKNTLGINSNNYSNFEAMKNVLIKKHGAKVILPVYMYDHSGQTIATTPFSCPWDSGQLGFIFVTRDTLLKEYGGKRVTPKIIETAERVLKNEIETLDQYVKGEVYGFKTKIDGEDGDSCWGFYGDNNNNGIFDHLDIEGLTREMYYKAFSESNWE